MTMTMHGLARLLALALLGFTFGCAGGMLGSPRDAYFDEPPYYSVSGRMTDAPLAHVRIRYQRGATQPASFDPTDRDEGPVARLLDEMNAYLDSLGVSTVFEPQSRMAGRAPDIHFGCERMPEDDCEHAGDKHRLRLAATNPSGSWLEWWRAETAQVGAPQVLVITLEVGNYLPVQRNLLGRKELRLGTGHVEDVPWLTALDRPVSVLQLTGALLDGDGRIVRMGAEGLLARRTNLLVGAFGAQRIIVDEDVEQARTARRERIAGQPLAWQVALRNMVAQLAARPELMTR